MAQNEHKEIQEGVNDVAPSLRLEIEDAQLIKDINKMLSESESLQEKMKKIGEENEGYWKGKQLEEQKLRRGTAKIVNNRLFMSAETIIPIMTSRTPEPTIRLKNPELREEVKQMLMNLWEVPTDDDGAEDMQSNFEMISRHWLIYRLGVLKYWYDSEIDDIRTRFIKPNRLRFDKKGRTVDECRFIAEYCDETLEGLIAKWPDKKEEILTALGKTEVDNSSLTYIEFITNEYFAYKFLNIILEKKKNPNFDYGDMNEAGKPIFNIFKKPRKPYLVLKVFNLGDSIYDDTSLFEQARSLQDSVNKIKRNIADNAADNGVLIGSGEYMDKKVLEAYTGAPDEKLFVKSGSATEALNRLPPKQMAPYIFSDLQDTKGEIDNLFGTHDTTRGENSSKKTATESSLLRQGDMGRIDILSRALDRIAQDWYTAMLHMNLVFKTKPVEINSNDEEGTSIVFDRNKFLNPETGELYKIIIKVKPGSSMSIDKDARRAEAMQLMQGGMIDPITFFERMDYSNPQEMAKKLFMWQDPQLRMRLFPDLQAEMQAQQQQQMEQETAVAANTPIPEGTPINLPDGSQANLTQPESEMPQPGLTQ